MRKQHYMTEQERHQLEAMRRNKIPVREIARQLGFCERTIYYELRRGSYMHTCDFWEDWMNNYPRKVLQWQTPNEAAA